MLPVDAQITCLAPNSTALVTPMVMPLSLKLPVGFSPSFFIHKFVSPNASPRRSERCRPVPPSLKVTKRVVSWIGMKSR